MVPLDRPLHGVEQLGSPLASFRLALIGVTERDAGAARQLLDRTHEVEMLDLAYERDDITLGTDTRSSSTAQLPG